MSSTILRQWLVLVMLPRPPRRIHTASIEAGLRERGIQVHRRTIQRDLLELAEVFPIVADERAKPYGWRWLENADGAWPFAWSRTRGGPRVELSLRLPRAQLRHVLDLLGSSDYEEVAVDDAMVSIAVKVDDSRTTRAAIFQVSDEVEVLAPSEWRREVSARARRVLSIHER